MPRWTLHPLARAIVIFALTCTASFAQKTINIPADYPTIQAGINAASTGDTVLVAPGTYYENLTISGKEISLTSTAGPQTTILDGSSKASVISIDHTPTLATLISGFTIRNGSGAGTYTAGITLLLAGVTVKNNTFISNQFALTENYGAVTFQFNTVIDSSPSCVGNGGLYLSSNIGTLDVTGQLAFSIVESNTFTGDGSACMGSAIFSVGNSARLYVLTNKISGFAAGFSTFPGSDLLIIAQNLITGNRQGGIYIDHRTDIPEVDPADVFIVNNTIANNSFAPLNTDASSPFGEDAGVFVSDQHSKVALINNIISTSSTTNPALSCSGTPSGPGDQLTPIILDSNLFWNATGPAITGACPSQVGSFGNFNADPLFANPAGADFTLRSNSPAIDAGNNNAPWIYSTDLVLHNRIVDATGRGFPIVDLGAYEAPGPTDAATIRLGMLATSYYLTPGSSATLTLQLTSYSSIPTGPITVLQDGVVLTTVNTDSKGQAAVTVSPSTPGSHVYQATYPGQGIYPATRAIELYILVAKYQPVIRLSSTPNPSQINQPVTFTATITSPDGVILSPLGFGYFSAPTNIVPTDAAGKASYTATFTSPSTVTYEAYFAGDAYHASASATVTQQVVNGFPTTTTLVSSVNPSSVNQAVTFTAQVTSSNGIPLGTVQFFDGATLLATQTLDSQGMATFTSSDLAIGTHKLTANFTSSGSVGGSTGSLIQAVAGFPTVTTLTAAPTSGPSGTPVQLTATVTGSAAPYGPLHHFYDGTPLANKKIAVFGDSTVQAATDFFLQLATHARPGDALEGLVVTPAVYNNPSQNFFVSLGNIFNEGHSGQPLRAMLALGEVDSLCTHGYSLIIFRGGLINDVRLGQTSTAAAQALLQQALDILHAGCPNVDILLTTENSLTIQDTNSYGYVQPETATAVQTYTDELYNAVVPFNHYFPNLIFYDVQQNLYGRTAPFTSPFMLDQLHPAPAGEIAEADLIAAFLGASRTSLNPGGTVAFYTGNALIGNSTLTNGIASFSTSSLPVGTNQVTAVYLGDADFAPSTSNLVPVTITTTPTTLSLGSSTNPSPAVVPLTFTAQLFANTGPATIVGQPVVFFVDGRLAATVLTAGQGIATFTTSTLAPGTHTISASFAGDLIHGPSASATVTEQVTPDATVTSLAGPIGTLTQLDPVQLLAAVQTSYATAIPNGTVTILEATTVLGTATVTPGTASATATASFQLSPLTPGTHNLVAVYAPGTASFLPSQSIAFTLIVVPASFTLTLSDPTLTLQTGHHHAETVSLSSKGGLGGTFNLSCDAPLPTYTTCTWTQTSVTLPASGTVSTSLTIDTDQLIGFLSQNRTNKLPVATRQHEWELTTLAALVPVTLLGLRRRNKLRPLLSLLLLATLATTFTACGADKYPASTAPGTYVLSVTATGPAVPARGAPTQTVNLILVVTP